MNCILCIHKTWGISVNNNMGEDNVDEVTEYLAGEGRHLVSVSTGNENFSLN